MRFHMSEADAARVSAAVTAAEQRSSGEIVTIIARRSDSYHDVGLHYAIAVVFLALAVIAGFPAFFRDIVHWLLGDWNEAIHDWKFLTFILGALIAKFLVVRYLLAIMPLRMWLTPAATKTRRVRRRAIDLFRATVEGQTRYLTGVLLYVSLDEHRAELVADRAINDKVPAEAWGEIMALLIDGIREDHPADGMIAAVDRIGAILAEHFPRSADDRDELSDRLVML